MEGNEFRALPALLAAPLSGSLHMCQSSFAEDIIINRCERWQIKTTGIKVHHIITCFTGKLPSPQPASFSSSSSSTSFSFILTSARFHHVSPLKIPLHPKGELEQLSSALLPCSLHVCSSFPPQPDRCHSTRPSFQSCHRPKTTPPRLNHVTFHSPSVFLPSGLLMCF